MAERLVDGYVRANAIALTVFDEDGRSPFHGVSPRTLKAFARRGLVWWDADYRGGLTDKGRAALAQLDEEEQS